MLASETSGRDAFRPIRTPFMAKTRPIITSNKSLVSCSKPIGGGRK